MDLSKERSGKTTQLVFQKKAYGELLKTDLSKTQKIKYKTENTSFAFLMVHS